MHAASRGSGCGVRAAEPVRSGKRTGWKRTTYGDDSPAISGGEEHVEVAQHPGRRAPDESFGAAVHVGHGEPVAADAFEDDMVAAVVRRIHQELQRHLEHV